MKLHNLTGGKPNGYATWGCMWEQGRCSKDTAYVCIGEDGNEIPMQTRITAYYADGSVKWTAHTADTELLRDGMEVLPTDKVTETTGIAIEETKDGYEIAAGRVNVSIPKSGAFLFTKLSRDGKVYGEDAKGVLILEEPVNVNGNIARMEKHYESCLEEVTLEECGPLQVIVKYSGCHVDKNGERKLPFIIRLAMGYNKTKVDITHTFLYDGDEEKDYLKGLGIQFTMPVEGELYNRHIKVMAEHGVFHEAVVPMVSWRPRPPKDSYEKQMAGEILFFVGEELECVNKILPDTPYWSTYDVCQDSATHFAIRKKLTGDHLCYIDALHGVRTKGGMSVGSTYGHVKMSICDFWEKYPSGYTVSGMDGDRATCTMWLWSPSAQAMDFRHYADRGYNQVCYEGYDYKGADAVGIACTNTCALEFGEGMIATDEEITIFADNTNNPLRYVATPEEYHKLRAFGYWSLPSFKTELEKWLEDQLDKAYAFYEQEVEQRGWYGMFNYGDFMHTYDPERHQWRYDIGGYAWDNTELVPTLWLWLFFMRTGRADVFRLAEKLSRHASEVDVYHMGKYKGLGSRHNVRHWGCPCKEARIAMASHHRFLYYMTGDRRLEDIFDELKDNEVSFLNKDPLGDFYDKETMVYPSHARSGPDWSSLCSNWMTQWERTLDDTYRKKIEVGMQDIENAPLKLVSGPDFEFDPATCHLHYIGERTTGGTHLQICMGAPQVWMEMADLFDDTRWKEMMAQYGRFYFLPDEERQAESNGLIGQREFSLPLLATGMGAYGAWYLEDDVLAERTWRTLLQTMVKENQNEGFTPVELENQGGREVLKEIPWVTTNFTAQFCLNSITALEFIRDKMPKTLREAERMVEGMDEFFFRKS